MTKSAGVRNEIAGKVKRLAGEVLGDQKLYDEGKTQEQDGHREFKESKIKPLGNLDQLT